MTATIEIANTGQTASPNTPPPNAGLLRRVRDVYFAYKKVSEDGATLTFKKIDEGNPQQFYKDSNLDYDLPLAKTAYLVIETENLRGTTLNIQLKPVSADLTGNIEAMPVMQGNASGGFAATNTLMATVGVFDVLNNRDGRHQHYTNLEAAHADKAILKIQLRPSGRADFDSWAERLGTKTVGVKVLVSCSDRQACAFKQDTKETKDPGEFLTEKGKALRVVNRNVFEIFYSDNRYNFLPENGNVKRKVAQVKNSRIDKAVFYYYDENDNQHILTERPLTNIKPKRRLKQIPPVGDRGALEQTISFAANRAAGESISATELKIYAEGTLGSGDDGDKWYGNQGAATVRMLDMDVEQTQGAGILTFLAFDYNREGTQVKYSFRETRRRSIKPEIFAGFLGALADFRKRGNSKEIVSTGFSYEDGSCYPSAEHVNGEAGDLYYINQAGDGGRTLLQDAGFDYESNLSLRNIFYEFGFQSARSENFSNKSNRSDKDDNTTILPHTTHTALPRHNNHLHIHNFIDVPDIYG